DGRGLHEGDPRLRRSSGGRGRDEREERGDEHEAHRAGQGSPERRGPPHGGPRGRSVLRCYFFAEPVLPPAVAGATGAAGAPLVVIGTVTAVGATSGPSRSSASYGSLEANAFVNATCSGIGVFAGTAPVGPPR